MYKLRVSSLYVIRGGLMWKHTHNCICENFGRLYNFYYLLSVVTNIEPPP